MNTRATLVRLEAHPDEKGQLVVGQAGAHIPFVPVRFFSTRDVPEDAVRGRHAHRQCHQFVVVLSGACRVTLIDGAGRDELVLDSPQQGLYVPPLTWVEQSHFAAGTVVLVLASDAYDAADYVRSLPEFLRLVSPT